MNFDEFKKEVNNNRPRLALVYLVPVLEELFAANQALKEEIDSLKSLPSEEKEPVKAPVKKTIAKKASAKPKQASEEKTETEE